MEHRDRLWPGGYTFLYDDGLFRPSTDTFLLGSFPGCGGAWPCASWGPERGF
ncbi:MAG: hypothetical protein ACLR5H_09150 [Oscillospiraceae bacterium]